MLLVRGELSNFVQYRNSGTLDGRATRVRSMAECSWGVSGRLSFSGGGHRAGIGVSCREVPVGSSAGNSGSVRGAGGVVRI